jgi:dUTP pyrophosphatase
VARVLQVLHVERNPSLAPGLVGSLVAMWTEVSRAGGAVGFTRSATAEEVRPVAEAAFARVRAGADDLAVAYLEGQPAGFGFLATNDWPMASHWATVRRLQRHPGLRGRGVGRLLLTELEAAAAERGLERLVLTVRGGTGYERFYAAHGYRVEARLPGRIQVDGEHVEELVMGKRLDGGSDGLRLAVRSLDPDLPTPAYAHPGDAGLDLRTRVDVELAPGERAVVPTGVAVAVPDGYVGLVHPRSGLAARHGLGVVNAPGTIDAGYRGEIQVILVNLDPREPLRLSRGDRVAQLVVQPVETVEVVEVDELPASARGEGGFGSTGRA